MIDVRFDGAVAIVDRAEADVVGPVLTYRTHRSSPRHGVVRTQSEPETLGQVAGDTFRFPAKLYPYVRAATAGRGVSLIPLQLPFGCCTPDKTVLESLPEPAKSIFSSNGTHFGGLFKSGPGTDPWTLVPQLLRLYPQYRIVLAVRNRREEAKWLIHLRASGLQQRVCNAVDLSGHWGNEPKVMVGSFQKLDTCGSHDFNVVVVPELQTIADNSRWDPDVRVPFRWDFHLLRLPIVPSFGFIARDHRPSRGEWLRLGSAFGPLIRVPGRDRAAVLVRRASFSHSATSRRNESRKDPTSFKRRAIWQNGERNRFVAGFAAEHRSASPLGRIMILVENPSHARELTPLLSQWAFRDMNGSPILDKNDRTLIVTEFWVGKTSDLDTDVLIDARGANAIDLDGFPRRAKSPDDSVLLVDVDDVGDQVLKANARERHERYAKRGWHPSSNDE